MSRIISEVICQWIKDLGAGHVFMVPGIQVEHLAWKMAEDDGLSVIVACHELGAGFMADGYARASGKPGVCMGIGGPGAAYLLPSAMVSRIDESPVLYITGDVPLSLKEYLCFQDTGFAGSRDREVFQKLIDFSVAIDDPLFLYQKLESIASRLKGNLPAHLVIPCDIQDSEVLPDKRNFSGKDQAGEKTILRNYEEMSAVILEHLTKSRHPLILAGHRVSTVSGVAALKRIAETFGIRVATTYKAKGILSEDHLLSLGIFGFAGTKQSLNELLGGDCDLLMIIGASLNQRNTFSFDERLIPPGRKVIYIDSCGMSGYPGVPEVLQLIVPDINVLLETAVRKAGSLRPERPVIPGDHPGSVIEADHACRTYKGSPRLDWALRVIHGSVPPDSMLFVDSGAHRIVAGCSWQVTRPGTFFTSDQSAPMGWAICAGIGAKLARPDALSIILTGDGCMRMHGLELVTAVRYSLPVIIIVSNNGTFYSVHQRAQSDGARKKLADLPLINWAEFGRAIGAMGCVVENPDDLDQAINDALNAGKPYIIDLRTHPEEPFPTDITLPAGAWPDLNKL